MKQLDVFQIKNEQIEGIEVRWGVNPEENINNKETEILEEGRYYIIDEFEQYYLVGSLFTLHDFVVLGSKHSYMVKKELLNDIQVISTIPEKEYLKSKLMASK